MACMQINLQLVHKPHEVCASALRGNRVVYLQCLYCRMVDLQSLMPLLQTFLWSVLSIYVFTFTGQALRPTLSSPLAPQTACLLPEQQAVAGPSFESLAAPSLSQTVLAQPWKADRTLFEGPDAALMSLHNTAYYMPDCNPAWHVMSSRASWAASEAWQHQIL